MPSSDNHPSEHGVGQPELVVGAIVVNPAGQVLIVQQRKWDNGYTCFVGGHVMAGEPVENALRRELREEIGIEADGVMFVGYDESIKPAAYERIAHLVFLNFVCRVPTSALHVPADGEIQQTRWVAPAEALTFVMESNRGLLSHLIEKGVL